MPSLSLSPHLVEEALADGGQRHAAAAAAGVAAENAVAAAGRAAVDVAAAGRNVAARGAPRGGPGARAAARHDLQLPAAVDDDHTAAD